MNPDSPQTPQEKLEASLTALLLGELPHEQAAQLHERLAREPALAKLYDRLKETAGLVRETMHSPPNPVAESSEPLKLSAERREKLLAHFKTVAPREFAEPKRRVRIPIIEIAIAASIVAILGALLLPALAPAKMKSSRIAALNRKRFEELSERDKLVSATDQASAKHAASTAVETAGDGSNVYTLNAVGYYNVGSAPPPAATIVLPPGNNADTGLAVASGGTSPVNPSSAPMAQTLNFGTFALRSPDAPQTTASASGAVEARPADGIVLPQFHSEVAREDATGGTGGGGVFDLAPAPTKSAESDDRKSLTKDDVGGRRYLGENERPVAPSASNYLGLRDKEKAGGEQSAQVPVEVVTAPAPALVPPTDVPPADPALLDALKVPAQQHQNSNQFIGRYAYLPPAEKIPDLDTLHELSGKAEAMDTFHTGESGLKERALADSTNPALGDLPTLGHLFKSDSAGPANRTTTFSAGTTGATASGQSWSQSAGAARNIENHGALTTTNYVAASENKTRQQAQQEPQLLAYQNASAELEEARRFQQILDAKIAAEKVDRVLPKLTIAEIPDKAVPATTKSSSVWDRIRGDTSRDYSSSARVKIERDQSDISSVGKAEPTGYDPYFIQSEFETIQSDAVLGQVVKDLRLDKRWAAKHDGKPLTTSETVQLLKKQLELKPVKNTSLLEIRARSDKPEEAAQIANSVAEAYQRYRTKTRENLARSGISQLEERYKEQQQKIQLAQAKVDSLRPSSQPVVPPTQDVARPKPAAPPLIPQPEIQSADNAFSTFSLNVSDVAFKLAAASLEKGELPDAGSMRSEEFINAFDYRDPEPPAGVAVAFASERAQYPFAQNRDLLRFSIKTAALGREPGKPLNLVLLLDNSGSMERADRVQIIREALRVLAAQLQPQDTLSIVTFARTPQLRVDGVSGKEAANAVEQVSGLTPEGGTNLEEAMKLAYATALRHYLARGVNRVVLLTDGAANLGDVDATTLKKKVEAHRKQGVALDCFGIGWEGYNDDLLEMLSRNGDGRYGFLNTPEEAATGFAGQLAGALHVAASDVKVQVEFNPKRVTSWRQIGYAKHQLTKEQFRDNTVDAAEIGAAESGNALYVIEVNPKGEGPIATVRARYKIPGTEDYREHEWPVAYSGAALPLDQVSAAMRLAATAGAFSEWLASSPYATEASPDALLRYLNGVPEQFGADSRPKKLEWMIRQAKSLSGK